MRGDGEGRLVEDDVPVGRHRPGQVGAGALRGWFLEEGAARFPGVKGAPPTDGADERAPDDGDDECGDEHDDEPADDSEPEPVRPFQLPESLREVEVRVGGAAIRGLLLIAVTVLLVLGGRWWWVQQGAGGVEAAPVGAGEHAAGSAAPTAAPTEVPNADPDAPEPRSPDGVVTPEAPATPSEVVVHVTGRVGDPGVVELPAGSRVVDAVDAAGGFDAEADRGSVNLARVLTDGEQVWVGAPGEEPPAVPAVAPPAGEGGSGAEGGAAGGDGSGGGGADSAPVDLNTADRTQLESLPGVGPVTAGRILDWREQHGGFLAVSELMEISGIGEKTYATLEPLVTVGR